MNTGNIFNYIIIGLIVILVIYLIFSWSNPRINPRVNTRSNENFKPITVPANGSKLRQTNNNSQPIITVPANGSKLRQTNNNSNLAKVNTSNNNGGTIAGTNNNIKKINTPNINTIKKKAQNNNFKKITSDYKRIFKKKGLNIRLRDKVNSPNNRLATRRSKITPILASTPNNIQKVNNIGKPTSNNIKKIEKFENDNLIDKQLNNSEEINKIIDNINCTTCKTETQVDDYLRRAMLNNSNVCGPTKKYTRQQLDNYRDNFFSFNNSINQSSNNNDDMVDRINEMYLENEDVSRNYSGIPIKDLFDGLVNGTDPYEEQYIKNMNDTLIDNSYGTICNQYN